MAEDKPIIFELKEESEEEQEALKLPESDYQETAKKNMVEAHEKLQIYKSGFLDGYNAAKKKEIKWSKIWPMALKAWKKRIGEK